ncbi:hypothetical protein JOM56_009909 [Amanita muscaria]
MTDPAERIDPPIRHKSESYSEPQRRHTLNPALSPAVNHISISYFSAVSTNWLLYGAPTVQVYLYYIAFPNDRKWVKAVVFTAHSLQTSRDVPVLTPITMIWNLFYYHRVGVTQCRLINS